MSNELEPKAVLFEPVELDKRVESPKAQLLDPLVLPARAFEPKAELGPAVVKFKELNPTAVF